MRRAGARARHLHDPFQVAQRDRARNRLSGPGVRGPVRNRLGSRAGCGPMRRRTRTALAGVFSQLRREKIRSRWAAGMVRSLPRIGGGRPRGVRVVPGPAGRRCCPANGAQLLFKFAGGGRRRRQRQGRTGWWWRVGEGHNMSGRDESKVRLRDYADLSSDTASCSMRGMGKEK